MVNYQLYRTNVLLGGQMKYDIVLESAGQDLVASDFHITPISSSVPYNKLVKENLLKYTHQDNISAFYKKISGHFFNVYGDSKLQGDYPIIVKPDQEKNLIDTHDSTYEMGCRRMPYQLYKKQFEFFVPLWLEHIPANKCLNFEFRVYGLNGTTPVCTKNFILRDVNGYDYHNSLVSYFKNYFQYVGTESGNDDLVNIDVRNNQATVSGINVETGSAVVKSIPHLLSNLFTREQPMMEFDSHIISSHSTNSLISRQLYNFNLCFNLTDILTNRLQKLIGASPVCIKLFVGLSNSDGTNNEVFEIKDFYSNYEYIPKKYCGPVNFFTIGGDIQNPKITNINPINKWESPQEINVLEYLDDHKCVDYINRNKLNQSIIHWSLVGDNDYICNAYPGFSGYYISPSVLGDWHMLSKLYNGEGFEEKCKEYIKDIRYIKYCNGKNPSIQSSIHNESINSSTWCNHIYINQKGNGIDYNLILSILNKFTQYASEFGENKLTNGIRYGGTVHRMCFVGVPDSKRFDLIEEDADGYCKFIKENANGKTIFKRYKYRDIYFFFYCISVVDQNYFTLPRFIELCEANKGIDGSDGWLSELIGVLRSASDDSQAMQLASSLTPILADSPSISSTEISYVKSDRPGQPMIRLFGRIKPTFTDGDKTNFRYSKKVSVVDEQVNELKDMQKYLVSNYSPVYPSISYHFIDHAVETYTYPNGGLGNDGFIESHWYNANKIIGLEPEISVDLQSESNDDGKYKKLDDLVMKFLGKYYGLTDKDGEINESDRPLLQYIKSLYSYKSSFDYAGVEDINNYIYSVKIELK